MDWNRIDGNWKSAKGKIKEKWGQLTDDDLAQINGRRDQLEGKIQQRYGLTKDLVRKDIDDWLDAQTSVRMDRGAKPDAKRFAGRYRVEPGNRRNWLQSNQRRKFGKREKAMSSSEGPERRPIIISARQARGRA
jgi:uncharacterized protein YjbJ (UPF0337 family)